MIKDVIPGFELYRPTTIADAVALLDEHKKEVWKLAGGNDSLSWFKDRIKRPKVVVELSGIAEMKGVKETADGIEIFRRHGHADASFTILSWRQIGRLPWRNYRNRAFVLRERIRVGRLLDAGRLLAGCGRILAGVGGVAGRRSLRVEARSRQ